LVRVGDRKEVGDHETVARGQLKLLRGVGFSPTKMRVSDVLFENLFAKIAGALDSE
jgi:hypothetical protein